MYHEDRGFGYNVRVKYFIFSIDDGTIYDRRVIDIFNKYHISATFNLNSGLDDFVWYLQNKPIERLKLPECISLYQGHEVASHSLSHPHLTMCPDYVIIKEVGEDIERLENIFHQSVNTFAFPFEDSDERCINIIKHLHNIKVIRLSNIDRSFRFPKDLHHVEITSLDVEDALNIFDEFIKDKEAKLFVFVSHAYDFEVNNTYEKLEALCKKLTSTSEVRVITMRELEKVIE